MLGTPKILGFLFGNREIVIPYDGIPRTVDFFTRFCDVNAGIKQNLFSTGEANPPRELTLLSA
jgi:hypothetical protein